MKQLKLTIDLYMLKWRRGVVAELILGDQVCLFHRSVASIYTQDELLFYSGNLDHT